MSKQPNKSYFLPLQGYSSNPLLRSFLSSTLGPIVIILGLLYFFLGASRGTQPHPLPWILAQGPYVKQLGLLL